MSVQKIEPPEKTVVALLRAHEERYQEARARIAEIEQDVARLDWVIRNRGWISQIRFGQFICDWVADGAERSTPNRYSTAREAIDAAIKESKAK